MQTHSLVIAVLGANGRLGSTVAAEAARRGHRVLAVTRDGAVPDEVARAAAGPARLDGRAADALAPGALAAAVAGAHVVVNALNPPYTRWRADALPMARNVVAACAATQAHHLFAGNIYGFGKDMPALLLPDTPEAPTSRKGAIRHEMEALFRAAAADGTADTTVLRAGDFFGGARPGGSWLDLLIASKLAKGRFTYPGPLDVAHAWAYLPDLASDFVDLAERHATLPGSAVLGHEGLTLTGAELKALVERIEGRPLRPVGLPWTVIRAMGLVHPMSREIAEVAYLWSTPHRIDGTALAAALGAARTSAASAASDARAAFAAALAVLRPDATTGSRPSPPARGTGG